MYDNKILDIVNNFKYSKWRCFLTQKSIAQRSLVALHNLFIVFNQIDLNAKDKCSLFDSLVGSIVNYGAEIFG